MDVEQIAGELYGLKPSEFTAARDAYVAEARRAKDTVAAKAIAALRKPALAAWAADLLARQRPEEAERFLALGEALREAHRTLDAERLRAASRQQHQLVATLARTAADLAREAGQPVSDAVLGEVEQTLHAVLAHPDVADLWAGGRLVKVPEAAVGFPDVSPEAVPPKPAREKAEKVEKRAEKEAEKAEKEAEERRRRDLAAARAAAAAAAAAEVERCERALGEAREAERDAADRAEAATERVRALERDLEEARQGAQRAGADAAEAREARGAAETALSEARRAATRLP
ncbi:hypothetical protein [Streptomyces sp. NPDC003327]